MEQQYEDEQSMEIEALQSIFMDDLRGTRICSSEYPFIFNDRLLNNTCSCIRGISTCDMELLLCVECFTGQQ